MKAFSALATALAAASLAVSPGEARAAPKVAVDVDFALPISMNGVKAGFGGALRGGYDVNLGLVHLMPEVGLGLNKLTGDVSPLIFRGFAGGRFGIGVLVRFDVFAHIGYAHVGYTRTPVGGASEGYGTPVFDTGLALDFTALPVLDLGIHASYNSAFSGTGDADTPKWLGLGVHLAVAL
jgi:hypothetical protein